MSPCAREGGLLPPLPVLAGRIWEPAVTASQPFCILTATKRRQLRTLLDLRAGPPISAGVRLFARAANLFYERYMTAFGYATLGSSIHTAPGAGRF